MISPGGRAVGEAERHLPAERVAAGDVLGGVVAVVGAPDEGEVVQRVPEAGGVDPVFGLGLVRLAGLLDEPALLSWLGSQAPTNDHSRSQTSTQVWLPRWVVQRGVPTIRAGIPTARQASIRRIDSPVHEA